MPKQAAHEVEDVQAWHDEAYAEYEKALEAYTKNQTAKTEAAYNEARDTLQTGVIYWRQVGEQVGTRTGVLVEDNTITPEDSE